MAGFHCIFNQMLKLFNSYAGGLKASCSFRFLALPIELNRD